MKKIILGIFVALSTMFMSAAQNTDQYFEFMHAHHMLDSSELHATYPTNKAFTSTAPPTGTVRAIPEWDPAQAVLIAYPGNFGIPYTLIAQESQYCKVMTIVASLSQQNTVTTNYTNNGVNIANCSFVIAPIDSYWSRDYGPWFIMTNNNTIAVVDFPYNRPSRPNDDNVPVVMANVNYLNEPLYGMNVMTTGGNYMCDGMGVAAMTDLITDENASLTVAQIDTAYKQYLGITHNYIVTDPLGQYIKHIDCWGKFLDVDKILIASVPTNNAQYSAYEATATYWANQTSSYGNKYQVYRTYEPNGEPYSNSFILNKKVFVPIMGGTHTTYDNAALAVYQQAMPGYAVVGVIGLGSPDSWVSTDALHCRNHEIADKGMLYIKHQPLLGEKPMQTQYLIAADVYALSQSALITDSAWVKYRVNHAAWNSLAMTHGLNNNWTANIPQQLAGDTIEYYIHASDLSPRSQTHPLIGQYDPHKFWIATGTTVVEDKNAITAMVFPNPAVNNLYVQMVNTQNATTHISLFDILGNEVKTIVEPNLDSKLLNINLSDIPSGTYFLQIVSGDFSTNKKIMVMR